LLFKSRGQQRFENSCRIRNGIGNRFQLPLKIVFLRPHRHAQVSVKISVKNAFLLPVGKKLESISAPNPLQLHFLVTAQSVGCLDSLAGVTLQDSFKLCRVSETFSVSRNFLFPDST